jgi:hypothetical protein
MHWTALKSTRPCRQRQLHVISQVPATAYNPLSDSCTKVNRPVLSYSLSHSLSYGRSVARSISCLLRLPQAIADPLLVGVCLLRLPPLTSNRSLNDARAEHQKKSGRKPSEKNLKTIRRSFIISKKEGNQRLFYLQAFDAIRVTT